MQPRGPFRRLTDAMRKESLRATLAAAPQGDEVWVFGYGSLMWSPCIAFVERGVGTVYGYQRRLCVWSSRARGTPDKPGLGFGLQPGDGQCRGVVYRLVEETLDADLKALWEREMTTGIYKPHWLRIETEKGHVDAIAFVVDPEHPQYAKGLSRHEMVEIIIQASGRYGPCREYLEKTVHTLAALGVNEPEFNALLSLVNTRT